jgi:hypothetical protein
LAPGQITVDAHHRRSSCSLTPHPTPKRTDEARGEIVAQRRDPRNRTRAEASQRVPGHQGAAVGTIAAFIRPAA